MQCCIVSEKDSAMKKSISYLLLSSVLAFGAVTAYANHHKGEETEKNEIKADVNNDGKVSYEEFKAAREKHMEEHFKRRDINGDGFIDESEKKAIREKRKERRKACKRNKEDGKY
jgi:Ca2+-binding EF-hand superfamily protein